MLCTNENFLEVMFSWFVVASWHCPAVTFVLTFSQIFWRGEVNSLPVIFPLACFIVKHSIALWQLCLPQCMGRTTHKTRKTVGITDLVWKLIQANWSIGWVAVNILQTNRTWRKRLRFLCTICPPVLYYSCCCVTSISKNKLSHIGNKKQRFTDFCLCFSLSVAYLWWCLETQIRARISLFFISLVRYNWPCSCTCVVANFKVKD